MTDQRIVRAGEVCRLLGLTTKDGTFPHGTLNNWVKQGVIRPVAGGNGTGDHRVFRLLPDVLAIVVGRGLRGKGFTSTAAANVMQRIMDHDADTLAELFAKGRGYLIVARDEVAPRFSTHEEVRNIFQENSLELDWVQIHPVAVNVGDLYQKMIGLLDSSKRSEHVFEPSLN